MAAAGEAFYLDTSFWVAASTVAFVAIIASKGVFAKLGKMLDDKSEAIRAQIDQARTLRDEAEKLLNEYQRKQREAEKEAADMKKQAEEDASLLIQEAARQIEALSERKVRIAEEKIEQAKAGAMKDVKIAAIEAAVEATRLILAEKLPAEKAAKLVDDAIVDVAKRLH